MNGYTLRVYACDLVDYKNAEPIVSANSESENALKKIGAYYLYRLVFEEGCENACYVIYDKFGFAISDWGQGRPTPKLVKDAAKRLLKHAGLLSVKEWS